ncbi:SDR family oxidoreductase [Dictyoglomus thermophilum]|uniref:Short-chain alcohol dehydrogenase n=1 Tax=Dictyoglomus thermophilum (strain ATCC 35947 / DSM 3960 / H-6-12) TaxID=309799 RepID=B5YBW7_DICT6|nr:SDR family oxidoreductase [Dictyoglomus thermophilum]ACI19076.1 short-chain alcohol dehydrogenase [Dictyoglomus thermophilum H-6-12]MCX7720786.1 SDR family oxidoreductase [Dictyoglomus thermophilum]
MSYVEELFSVKDKVAFFTGGGGILASAISEGLGKAGAKIVLTDINEKALMTQVEKLKSMGITAEGFVMNALEKENVKEVAEKVKNMFGKIDILLNAAGGNIPEAVTSDKVTFWDLPIESIQKVVNINLFAGAIIPSQIIGKMMVENPEGGVIINFASMSSFRPLTRVVGYSAAKAAVANFTQWLAVYVAKEFSPKVRVNAIAPGFLITNQNRYLLLNEDGTLTPRGKAVIEHTPMGRFGEPEELIGTIIWLASPASSFVTGAVIPIDGGFNAFSGV